jgi:putative ABC transport system permease protein
MSRGELQVVAGAGFALVAAALAWRVRLGLARDILVAAARAAVQLAAVGAVIAAVFGAPGLAFAFVGAMVVTAAATSGGRLRPVHRARLRAAAAIALPALTVVGVLLAVGAFAATPRAGVPTAAILIGGAMTATTLTGRRLVEGLRADADEVEARLCLGDDVRSALAPVVRRAVVTALVPLIDQTRSVGLVTLPGTFVGLVLGGASPAVAARTQLVVLLALLLVELLAALTITELVLRTVIAPGDRVEPLPADRR